MGPFLPELKHFIEGALVVDCVDMQLESQNPDSRVFSGPGSINQTTEGELRLKLYCPRSTSFEDLPELRTSYKAGEIIPDEAFFALKARDITGRVWTANYILPNTTTGSEGTVLTADLRQLSTQQEMKSTVSKPALLLGYPRSVDIPGNVNARTVDTLDGKKERSRLDLDRAQFSAYTYDFDLKNRNEGWFLARVKSREAEPAPAALDLRVSAALQFVLSRRLRWSLYESWEGDTLHAHLRPFRMPPEPALPRVPVSFRSFDKGDSIWTLFERYFEHVSDYDRAHRYHPLTALVNQVLAASSSALETQALVTAAAIEGLLNLEFQDTARPGANERDALLEQIDAAVDAIEAESQLQQGFKTRVCKWLRGSLPNPRAVDKLHQLVEEGLLERRLVDAWDETRPRAAHGGFFSSPRYGSPNRTRRLDRSCYQVRQLFNQLVFLAIGYEGPYTDYSTVAWPMRREQIA